MTRQVVFESSDSFVHERYNLARGRRVYVDRHLAAQWEVTKLGKIIHDAKPPLVINGMHGMGDNLHQRALVRDYMKTYEVWLDTPWPSIYHDMPGLHLMNRGSKLRTQAKNQQREAALYDATPPMQGARAISIKYPPALVREHRGVLAAMYAQQGMDTPGDFRMPVPYEWGEVPAEWLPIPRPLIVFRPLVERTEWTGCKNRNPEWSTHSTALALARIEWPHAFVVSIADLEPGNEWLVQPELSCDVQIHDGSLSFRQLAALWAAADLVISPPGFGVVLAQAVGTPVAVTFGGYEGNYSFDAGARYTPTHRIGKGCDCFSHTHDCVKTSDGLDTLSQFIKENCK